MKLIPLSTSLAVLSALGLSACANTPRDAYTQSAATVRAAEAVGAAEHPRASYHLELAKEQLAVAEPLVDGSNADRKAAAKVLARAEADAELALALAESAELEEEARDVWAGINELQKDRD